MRPEPTSFALEFGRAGRSVPAGEVPDGGGIVLDLSSLLDGNTLKSKERSAPQRLDFQVSDLRPAKPERGARIPMVTMDAHVLGHLETPPDKKN